MSQENNYFTQQDKNEQPNNSPLQNNQVINTNNEATQSNINLNNPFENKKPKKLKIGLIIGIAVVLISIGAVIIFVVLNSNKSSGNNTSIFGSNSNILGGGPSLKYGNVNLEYKTTFNKKEISYGLFKIGDEYIYKGTDNYWVDENGQKNVHKFEQGYLNNFVKFNNNYWRIVKINPDGTIKLIWAGTLLDKPRTLRDGESVIKVENQAYFESKINEDKNDTTNYENSIMRNYLNTEVLNNTSIIPSNYSEYLTKSNWNISTYDYDKIVSEQKSTFSDYIGAVSIDEYQDACYINGGTETNPVSTWTYCYFTDILSAPQNTQLRKTFTISMAEDEEHTIDSYYKITYYNGNFAIMPESFRYDGIYKNNILPVIVLKSDIKFESGEGTVDTPYLIK